MKASAAGFTLVELLITIAIISILSVQASGLFRELQMRMQTRASVSAITNSLSLARTSALTRQMNVTLCGSSTATTCDNQWSNGILVMIDADGNGQPDREVDILGFYQTGTTTAARISWKGFGSGNRVTFGRRGQTSFSNGSFTYCPASQDARYARQVVINRGGRVRLSQDRDRDGVHEDSQGKPLNCLTAA